VLVDAATGGLENGGSVRLADIGEPEVAGGASSGLAIRRPPSALDRLRSPLIVVAESIGVYAWRRNHRVGYEDCSSGFLHL
jgi:hypothetical protein